MNDSKLSLSLETQAVSMLAAHCVVADSWSLADIPVYGCQGNRLTYLIPCDR